MNLKQKIKFIKKDKDLFFTLKTGTLIEMKNIYYQTPKWFANIFKFYYYSGMMFYISFILFLFTGFVSSNLYISIILTILLYLSLEFVFLILTPMKEIRHWKAY
jgi:hypothetical protein